MTRQLFITVHSGEKKSALKELNPRMPCPAFCLDKQVRLFIVVFTPQTLRPGILCEAASSSARPSPRTAGERSFRLTLRPKYGIKSLLSGLTVAGLASSSASACFLEFGWQLEAWEPSHPQAAAVQVATKTGINSEQLPKLGAATPQNQNTMLLYSVYRSLAAYAEKTPMPGPSYKVLFVGTGLWVAMNGNCAGSCFHAEPPVDGETSIVISDPAMALLVAGTTTFETVLSSGTLVGEGPEAQDALFHFTQTLESFAGSNIGKRSSQLVQLMLLRTP